MNVNYKKVLKALCLLQIAVAAIIILNAQGKHQPSFLTNTTTTYYNHSIPNCVFKISIADVSKMQIDDNPMERRGQLSVHQSICGRVKVVKDGISMNEVELQLANRGISAGGFWCPVECTSPFKVAILIPFRNREAQLSVFLRHIHPFLQNQMLEYAIYVVEQTSRARFNRGTLFNIGYVESNKRHPWQCHINHDVDLLPEDSRNYYSCPEGNPRHMISAYDRFGYKLVYETNFGGVTAFTTAQFHAINGYSNKFFGWGGEDDDLWNRAVAKGYKPFRYPAEIGRYSSLTHNQEEMSPDRMNLLYNGSTRFATDGLNTLNYNVSEVQVNKLYTKFIVDIL